MFHILYGTLANFAAGVDGRARGTPIAAEFSTFLDPTDRE